MLDKGMLMTIPAGKLCSHEQGSTSAPPPPQADEVRAEAAAAAAQSLVSAESDR